MKIKMPVKKMIKAVEKGSIAALTQDAQDEERKKTNPTDSCIKIESQKDKIIFESSSPQISAQYSMTKDSDIECGEGAFCVEASSYLKVLGTVKKDFNVEVESVENTPAVENPSGLISSNGRIFTTIWDKSDEKRKGKNDIFPVSEFTKVNYDFNNVVFSIGANKIKKAIDSVCFATDSTDMADLLDRVAIVTLEDALYFAATDGKRCAIYKLPSADAGVKINGIRFLIRSEMLILSTKSFDDSDIIECIDTGDKEHIILSSKDMKVRLSIASEDSSKDFPDFLKIMGIPHIASLNIDKEDLASAVEFVSQYNQEKSAIYIKGNNKSMRIEAARRGEVAEYAMVTCEDKLKIDDKDNENLPDAIGLSNQFIREVFKRIEGDILVMYFYSNGKKMKIQSKTNENYIYLMQSMQLP